MLAAGALAPSESMHETFPNRSVSIALEEQYLWSLDHLLNRTRPDLTGPDTGPDRTGPDTGPDRTGPDTGPDQSYGSLTWSYGLATAPLHDPMA